MAGRDNLVEYLESKLVGPGLGQPDEAGGHDREVIEGRLSLGYLTGILFPILNEHGQPANEAGEEGDEEDDDDDAPLRIRRSFLQSALGISFCLKEGDQFTIETSGAFYEPLGNASGDGGDPRKSASGPWKRRPVSEQFGRDEPFKASFSGVLAAFEDHVAIKVKSRAIGDGRRLITVTAQHLGEATRKEQAYRDAVYQVSIEITSLQHGFEPYPHSQFLPSDLEQRELALTFGEIRAFAAGHGVGADWAFENGLCRKVFTTFVPTALVWRPLFDMAAKEEDSPAPVDAGVFKLANLARRDLRASWLAPRLRALADAYGKWIDRQNLGAVPKEQKADASRIIDRCKALRERLLAGIIVLEKNDSALTAFRLANEAMLRSMAHAKRARGGKAHPTGKQGPFALGEAETDAIDYYSLSEYSWRPFQLAFLVQLIPSLMAQEDSDRDKVDVIWFATGGGKTEAYLLAAAFELIRRRLDEPQRGAGVGVINRYTYRFLTADQFQRTSSMICGLESIRREGRADDAKLGDEPFSVGLYVGDEISPNTLSKAHEKCQALWDSDAPRADNPFPIESCPWCGTLLAPDRAVRDSNGDVNGDYYGFRSTATSFNVRCPDEACAFHDGLPTIFIDDLVYTSKPSFLLGTIDKFAMLAWVERAGRLFNGGARNKTLPPSLVIQDELHLISGPLGTLAGIYEASFETISMKNGIKPKIIASTATARNASVQCRRIYGRDASIFPPPGLQSNDSFFSRLDVGNESRARLYAGVMAQGQTSTVAATWILAALSQGVESLAAAGQLTEEETDAYWTLVAYHNSRRELSRIANAASDEVLQRMKVYAESDRRPSRFAARNPGIMELRANAETPVPQARQVLSRTHGVEPAVDFVPCTNIISVGVDIDRLGLMAVNGQPKLTAEYIQASSRVGRGDVPGLVLTMFSQTKPRDRSHFESFVDYHQRFYSFVEPTSVTPGSLPALDRAAHAALVIAIRHAAGLLRDDKADQLNLDDPLTASVIQALKARMAKAYVAVEEDEEQTRITQAIDQCLTDWMAWIDEPGQPLRYVAGSNQRARSLLYKFDGRTTQETGWPTLQSMRHVDIELELDVGVPEKTEQRLERRKQRRGN